MRNTMERDKEMKKYRIRLKFKCQLQFCRGSPSFNHLIGDKTIHNVQHETANLSANFGRFPEYGMN